MAMLSFLRIQAAGDDAPVLFGEDNTQNSMGRTDVSAWLECSAFDVALETGQRGAHGSSQSTSKRLWQPARFVLRLGKSTPWLFDAGRTNKNIDLTLHFFNRHHETRAVEQHFQYRIEQGRIVSVRIVQPDVRDPAQARMPEFVELHVVPNISELESMTGGTTMVDDWANYGA